MKLRGKSLRKKDNLSYHNFQKTEKIYKFT